MMRTQWQTEIENLRRDNRSGSEEIAARALELLIDVIDDSMPDSEKSYRQWLLRIGRELVAAQPSMGVLFRLVSDMLWACHKSVSGGQIRQDALIFLQDYQAHVGAALDALAGRASEYLAKYPVIMTYSRSSTVVRVLRRMAERSLRVRVLCSEGRPMLEGQILANELGWAGMDVTLGVDMALFSWLPEASALLLGADSLTGAGIVNKIGSVELVRAAFELDIPRIVVCTSHKFLPSDYPVARKLRAGDPNEIMPSSDANVIVRNVNYDVTPLEIVSLVITEKALLRTDQVAAELAHVQAYPGLRGK